MNRFGCKWWSGSCALGKKCQCATWIFCPKCLAENLATETELDFSGNQYVCFFHGPVVTCEFTDTMSQRPL